MHTFLKRLTPTLLVLAALYWVPVNVALNLPATQAWLNRLAPEVFTVTWQRAWSPWPLRVVLVGLAADGQARNLQWQLDAARLGVSVKPLPLLRDGRIWVHHPELVDLDLRLRPLPEPGAAPAPAREFYPVIRHRDPAALAGPASPPNQTLRLIVDDLRLQGRHGVWYGAARLDLPGSVRARLRLDMPLAEAGLTDGLVDLRVESLRVGPVEHVTEAAWIKGHLDLPTLPLASGDLLSLLRLPGANADLDLDLPVLTLDFLPWLVVDTGRLGLHGHGRLRGHLRYREGNLLGGSTLDVDAKALAMHLGRFAFTGDGAVALRVDPADEGLADLSVRFNEVQAHRQQDGQDQGAALLIGRGVEALLHTRTRDHADGEQAPPEDLRLTLTIPSVEVPDLASYDPLLPGKWGLRLLGGVGVLSGHAELTPARLDLALDLGSDEAAVRWRDEPATTDLLLQLRAGIFDAGGHGGATLDMTGTGLRIGDARVAGADSWQGELRMLDARLHLPARVLGPHQDTLPGVLHALSEQGLGTLLGQADGHVRAALTVSALDWIAELLHRPLGLAMVGAAELDAEMHLADGWPAVGSTLRIPPTHLTLDLLEHRVQGQGQATLSMEQAGHHPRLRLAAGFTDALLQRRDETAAGLGAVHLDALVLAPDPLHGGHGAPPEVSLKVHQARVADMAVYNAYLPAHAPLRVKGGTAGLIGELHLGADSARGTLVLDADDLGLALGDTALTSDLRLEVLIRDGSPGDMRFDITGSSLVLDDVRVAGAVTDRATPDWHARLQLEETEAVWHKPVQLDLKAGLTVRDTRPFVALVDNLKGQHPWLDNLLTMQDLAGHLRLRVDQKGAVIDDAMVSAAAMAVHGKAHSSPEHREALLLLRWENLLGNLALQDGQRHFALANAREHYEAWRPGRAPLPGQAPEPAAPPDSTRPPGHGHAPAHAPPGAGHPRPAPTLNPFQD